MDDSFYSIIGVVIFGGSFSIIILIIAIAVITYGEKKKSFEEILKNSPIIDFFFIVILIGGVFHSLSILYTGEFTYRTGAKASEREAYSIGLTTLFLVLIVLYFSIKHFCQNIRKKTNPENHNNLLFDKKLTSVKKNLSSPLLKKCPFCGNKIDYRATICLSCGEQLKK